MYYWFVALCRDGYSLIGLLKLLIWRKAIIRVLLTVIFILGLLLCLPKLAYTLEVVDCSNETKSGACPRDLINHRCQVEKISSSSQVIILGRCENVKEDIDNDGEDETLCKCVENSPPDYSIEENSSSSSNNGASIIENKSIDTTSEEPVNEENNKEDEEDDSDGKNKLIDKIKDKIKDQIKDNRRRN